MKSNSSKPPKLVIVGSMNLDISVQVEDIPQPGETVLGFNLAQSPGGKGSNQAAAASLSGAQTHLVAVVGEDEFGSQLIAKAQGIGIDTQFVSRTLGQKTGTALITVDSKGENSIVVASGANLELSSELVETSFEALGEFELVLVVLEIQLSAARSALETAKKMGSKTVLNLSPYNSEAKSLVAFADFLIVNEHEFKQLVGVDLSQSQHAHTRLQEMGAKQVIVTLGSEGAVLIVVGDLSIELVHFPTKKVEVVDTTGCGDAFAGAFSCEIASGKSAEDSIQFALKAASFAATRFGAQVSYGSRSEVLSH